MPCGVKQKQVNELDRAMSVLSKAGLGPGTRPWALLNASKMNIVPRVGYKFPRLITMLLRLIGLSPGEVKIWHDCESGWISQARHDPSSPWVYKYVPDDIAISLLKGELTHELEDRLMTPDTYIGE